MVLCPSQPVEAPAEAAEVAITTTIASIAPMVPRLFRIVTSTWLLDRPPHVSVMRPGGVYTNQFAATLRTGSAPPCRGLSYGAARSASVLGEARIGDSCALSTSNW
jgi:hypothetical protein